MTITALIRRIMKGNVKVDSSILKTSNIAVKVFCKMFQLLLRPKLMQPCINHRETCSDRPYASAMMQYMPVKWIQIVIKIHRTSH